MTALALLLAMLSAFAAIPTIGDDSDGARSVSQQTAGCGLAVALALFVGAQVLA